MTPVLLTISFLIHIFTISVWIACFLSFKKKSTEKQEQEQAFFQSMQHFLEVMKKENERLLHELERKENIESSHSTQQQKLKNLEKNDISNQTEMKPINSKEQLTPSLHAKVLYLHEKGLTNEQIAKQLKCGKTEVSLIITFYEKK